MSERRRRKNPRFLKETSDRSGFDNWHRTQDGSFYKDWTGIKQSNLLLEPEEFDMPPPSNRPLGGADISGIPLASSMTAGIIDSSNAATVQTLYADTSQIYLTSQIALYIQGSADNTLLRNYTGGNDTYTKLLLHGDATPIIDSTSSPKTVTVGGSASYSTLQKVFGSGSILFQSSNSDFLSLADSDDWYFGTGDVTIDFRIRFNTVSTQYLISQITDASNRWGVYYEAGVLKWFNIAAGVENISISNNWTPVADTWYHVTLVRVSNVHRMYIDGTQIGIGQTDVSAFGDYTGKLKIGCYGSDGSEAVFFNGYLDEIRISKGIARWTSNFTPPSLQYSYTSSFSNQIASGASSQVISIQGVGNKVVIVNSGGVSLYTDSYEMNSGSILNLIYNGVDTWQETSRSHI